MAEYIQLTPDELNTAASNIKDYMEELLETMNKMTSAVENVCAGWDGAAEQAFYNGYTQLKAQLDTAIQTDCEAFCEALTTTADTLQQADTQLGSSISGTLSA